MVFFDKSTDRHICIEDKLGRIQEILALVNVGELKNKKYAIDRILCICGWD